MRKHFVRRLHRFPPFRRIVRGTCAVCAQGSADGTGFKELGMVYNDRMDEKSARPRQTSRLRRRLFLYGGLLLLVLAAATVGLIFLSRDEAQTRTARDIFLILLALEFMVVGVALTVLVVQLARLMLLVEMEIRPMLENANETLDALRGTTLFLSETLVEPAVKLQSTLAGIQRVLEVLGIFRKPFKR
jgi:hypothetical protein